MLISFSVYFFDIFVMIAIKLLLIMAHIKAAIMAKSMSELAQTPLLDADGNLTEESMIVAQKTQKIIKKVSQILPTKAIETD